MGDSIGAHGILVGGEQDWEKRAATLTINSRLSKALLRECGRLPDRTLGPAGGNPNLLTAAGTELALIDHGNSFDPEFGEASLLSHHAFAGSRAWWQDKSRRAAWERHASAALDRLPVFWEAIPPDWHENKYGDILHHKTLEKVDSVLHRFASNPSAFWAGLLSS